MAMAALPMTLVAQALPPYVPTNPVLASRSPLYAQPIVDRRPGWHTAVTLDYGNAIETSTATDGRTYLFDAETSQVDLWLGRDLGDDWFSLVNVPIRGAHDGWVDAFLNGYHDLIGIPVPARNRRPIDTYGWVIELPDGVRDLPRASGPFLGDLRVAMGRRLGAGQLVLSATLPTSTASVDAWSRGTVGLSLSAGTRVLSTPRVRIEAAVMAGFTPTTGDLTAYQRTSFVGASSSLWWRFWGQQAIYGTFFLQSAGWKGTGFSAMEAAEFTLDAGGLLRLRSGWPALQLGITEDLVPRGPAVDIAARIGLVW